MHLDLGNDMEVLEVQENYNIPRSRRCIQQPQLTEPKQNMHIIDRDDQMYTPNSYNTSYLMKDLGEQFIR